MLGKVFRRLSYWLESCPCHATTLDLCTAKRIKHVGRLFRRFGSCPVGGSRGPELAAGDLEIAIGQFMQISTSRLLADLPASADEHCRKTIAEEMQKARAYLELGLRVKFDFYKRLPWVLLGVGHYKLRCRREAAQKALQLFAESQAVGFTLAHQHPLTAKFLAEGGWV